MALVLTITDFKIDRPQGDELVKSKVKAEVTGTIAFDSSYPTGGEAIDALLTTAGYLSSIDSIKCEPTAGYVFSDDRTNGKIIAYFGDNNNASDGVLIEIANTTDLSVTCASVPFVARGNKLGTGA